MPKKTKKLMALRIVSKDFGVDNLMALKSFETTKNEKKENLTVLVVFSLKSISGSLENRSLARTRLCIPPPNTKE